MMIGARGYQRQPADDVVPHAPATDTTYAHVSAPKGVCDDGTLGTRMMMRWLR